MSYRRKNKRETKRELKNAYKKTWDTMIPHTSWTDERETYARDRRLTDQRTPTGAYWSRVYRYNFHLLQ